MAFEAEDFHELVSLLKQHPDWQEELRRLLLSEQLLSLPELVRHLAESQKRTDETVRQLAEAQLRTTEQISQLTARVDDLTQRLEQLTARVDDLTQRLEQLTRDVQDLGRRLDQLAATVTSLAESMQRMGDEVAKMREFYLEQRYYTRAPAYFGKIIRRVRTVSYDDLCHILDDATDAGVLTEAERDDLVLTDVVVQGRKRTDGEQVYLIVEVSWGIGFEDVQRAVKRAQTFAKLGWKTLPVVAGGWASADVREAAKRDGAVVVIDGGVATLVYQ